MDSQEIQRWVGEVAGLRARLELEEREALRLHEELKQVEDLYEASEADVKHWRDLAERRGRALGELIGAFRLYSVDEPNYRWNGYQANFTVADWEALKAIALADPPAPTQGREPRGCPTPGACSCEEAPRG